MAEAAMDEAKACAGGLEVEIRQRAPIPFDVRLDCRPGELLALVGPSGSGKTSVLRAIAGLLTPRHGRITLDGEAWLDSERGVLLAPQQRRVGLVFQDYALFPHLTARENVAIAVAEGERQAKLRIAEDLLVRVNLAGLDWRRPDQLSGGQQQRVAIARALARQPRVLLLDEPFSAVDQMTRERLKLELAVLRRTLTIPILLVTHDLDEALALADRLGVLHRGEMLQIGPAEVVRMRPRTPTVARLLGQPNVFRGRLLAAAAGGRPGRIDFAGAELEVAETGGFVAGTDVQWMIPSDAIVLHRRGRPSLGERENPLVAVVSGVTALGDQTAVTARLAGDEASVLNFRLPTHSARRNEIAAGAEITVSVLAGSIQLLMPDL